MKYFKIIILLLGVFLSNYSSGVKEKSKKRKTPDARIQIKRKSDLHPRKRKKIYYKKEGGYTFPSEAEYKNARIK